MSKVATCPLAARPTSSRWFAGSRARLAISPGACHWATTWPASTVRAVMVLPDAPKTTDSAIPSSARWDATAMALNGAVSDAWSMTLFGSATTMPAAIRYLASIGCVHS